jgi:uncharacterized repeat protein (TIGR03803 family)
MLKLHSRRCPSGRISFLAALFVIAAASPAFAQYTLNVLTTDVEQPVGTLVLSGNTLYGAERNPDEWYSLPASGGTPTELTSINSGAAGDDLSTGLILSGSTLYGASIYSGVYSVPTTGGTATNIGNVTNGYFDGCLLLDGGTLYSSTGYSDPGNGGIVSISTTGGGANLLADFSSTSNGYMPLGGLISSVSGTTLYGTASQGGASSDGTVFKFSISDNAITRLASFNGTDGENPASSLVLSGSTLYGTTPGGGAFGDGVVFSLPVAGGTPTVLLSFNGANGADPMAGLLLSNGILYGTTYGGGAFGDGEVFSLPTTGGTPTLLASFDGTDGSGPAANLIMDSNGDLFGTTSYGTIFELAVPEPTSASLLAITSLALLCRSRRRTAVCFAGGQSLSQI